MKFPLVAVLGLFLMGMPLPAVLAGSPPPAIASKPTPDQDPGEKLPEQRFIYFLKNYFQSAAYQSESRIEIQAQTMPATSQGMTIRFQAQIKAALAKPNQLRATIDFLDDKNQSVRQYEVASNGKTLTTFSPTLRQHHQQPYSSDLIEEQLWILGLGNLLYLTVPEDVRNILENADVTGEEALIALRNTKNNWSWSFLGHGPEGDRYELTFKDQSLRLEFLLDAVNGDLKKISTTGEDPELRLTIIETIADRRSLPSLPPETFRLVVPAGSKAVENLEISPL